MKSSRLLFLLVSIFLPLLAKADYWISVASFKNRDSAETALVNAQSLSAQQFGVLGSATDKGYFFRVVAGPYSSSSAAKDAQVELALAWRQSGLDLNHRRRR
jgi:cell division septation protein DedD